MKFLKNFLEISDKEKNNFQPWFGVFYIVVIFFASQFIAGFLVSLYPVFRFWNKAQATSWLNNSVIAQFCYVFLAEAITLAAIWYYLKLRKIKISAIGIRKPKWTDLYYALVCIPIYYAGYLIVVFLLTKFWTGFNVNQAQQIGFNNVHGLAQLILTFISLVILPPIAEEIMVRGFLYSNLKKIFPIFFATIITSIFFASAHLPEGGSSGLLWVGAADTFVLSLVLIYLREKTKGLYSSMILHAVKNGVAFYLLFIAVSTR